MLTLPHVWIRAPGLLREAWRAAGGSDGFKKCSLDVAHVHRLGAALSQRRLELIKELVVEVAEIVRILNANRVKGRDEALSVANLD